MIIVKCKRCRKEKPETDFSLFRGKRNQSCKECREKNNKWYAEDKGERRTKAKTYYQRIKNDIAEYRSNLRLDRKYKLTREKWNEMLAEQKGLCSLCKEEMKKPCVDHDHNTGKVRGLLHRECNLKLHAIEDTDFLIKAQTYLDSMK